MGQLERNDARPVKTAMLVAVSTRAGFLAAGFLLLNLCSGCGDPSGTAGDQPGTSGVTVLPSGSSATSNLDIPANAFRQEFDDILDAIDARYAFEEMKTIDVAQLRSSLGPEIDRATTPEAFYATLVRLFAALHNSHSGLLLPSSARRYGTFGAELVGDRLYLTGAFADTTLPERGLARGWEVASIDGTPFASWLAQRVSITSASTSQYSRLAAASFATQRYWYEPALRHYRLVSPQGAVLELDASLDRAPWTRGLDLVTSQSFGDVGYVAVNSMTGNVVQRFEEELARVVDSRALILDLRSNQGGNSSFGHPIIAHLIGRPIPVVLPTQILQPDSTLQFSGPLAVLIGPRTHSAAESTVFNLHDADRGTFIGTETAGSSGNGPEAFQTAHGIVFRMPTRREPDRSPAGTVMEGVGLAPHIVKEQSYGDFLDGRDTVLEFALDDLRGH